MEDASMAEPQPKFDIYIEVGKKKTFAVAIDWPGWSRFGRDEEAAVSVLFKTAGRYSEIAGALDPDFAVPTSTQDFNIVARLEGNSTTDFGAPAALLPDEWDLMDASDLPRCLRLMQACWSAFDQAVEHAEGKELRKGPRGGGRDLAKIVDHVVQAEKAYLKKLGWNKTAMIQSSGQADMLRLREEVRHGLEASLAGQLPREGPRGGKRWPPSFFIRRLSWHVVDHAWEIQDRVLDL
jgi:hypothetical protein